MTGNSAPPRRKIQALTVSVNYADFLECIAPNRRHFDRWLVVTDEKDTRTQEVCRQHGMDVLFSKRLYEKGAAFHKAAALNEGLAALDQNAWVAVMDSDILLPHDFR
jgi:glycosyltransferase involved in cell wall biosynthesis